VSKQVPYYNHVQTSNPRHRVRKGALAVQQVLLSHSRHRLKQQHQQVIV
jgi:hypothetical protein